MATFDTLPAFVPEPGFSTSQLISTSEATTNNRREALRSDVFAGETGRISDANIQLNPVESDTTTAFRARSENSQLVGNESDNQIFFGGRADNVSINTAGGEDSVNVNSFVGGSIDLGDGNDVALTGAFTGSSILAGAGDDLVTIRRTATSVDVDMGTGDDTLIFGGRVLSSSIDMGAGADELRFSGSVRNTTIDLGGDTDIDTVYFETRSDLASGTVITGASEGDELIIGGTEYVYNSEQNAWITDGDTITFG
ncbi:hypothetical protein H6G65_13925 [Microcystis elabens FACHB-917]|nr:hypothetical protein [Microcystis elabens FACHB-917]